MKSTIRKMFINLATRFNNPQIHDEFFVPKSGLQVKQYIDKGDKTGSHHLLRYEWASKTIANLGDYHSILDVASGAGYGSFLLASQFPDAQITGIDYDSAAIKAAKASFNLPNINFRLGDMTRWEETIGTSSFDCITSFDTLEHISHREIALENLVNHLAPNGSLLFSTPCGEDTNNLRPIWAYHKIEFSTASLYDLLSRYFKTIIAPESPIFPNRAVFDQLKGSQVEYRLRMNPVICQDPIVINNPYKK